MQKQYVEKPTKVLAEQYVNGVLPAGACECMLMFPFERTGGPPHAHVADHIVMLTDTDWVLMKPHHPGVVTDVLSATEFADRFGEQGPPL